MSHNGWLKHVNVLMCYDRRLNLSKPKCLNRFEVTTIIHVKEFCMYIMKVIFFWGTKHVQRL